MTALFKKSSDNPLNLYVNTTFNHVVMASDPKGVAMTQSLTFTTSYHKEGQGDGLSKGI
jgi:hypothetical protein